MFVFQTLCDQAGAGYLVDLGTHIPILNTGSIPTIEPSPEKRICLIAMHALHFFLKFGIMLEITFHRLFR